MLKIFVEVTGDTRVTAVGVFSVETLLDFEITHKKKKISGVERRATDELLLCIHSCLLTAPVSTNRQFDPLL